MRNIIFGSIGVLWGRLVLVSGASRGFNPPGGSSSYQAGWMAALVFGVVLLAAGAYYLHKGIKQRQS